MIYTLLLDNQKALKTVSRPLHSKLKKFLRLFKDLHRNLRTFKKNGIQGLPPKIQRLFKTVQTLDCQCTMYNKPLQQHFICKNCLKTFPSRSFHPNK